MRQRSPDDESEFIYAAGSIAGLEGKKYGEASSQFVFLTYDADNT